jgi:hypothetical protein
VAATCLFLAGKVEEKPARVSEVVQMFYQVLFKRGKVAAVPRKESKVRATLLFLCLRYMQCYFIRVSPSHQRS